MHTEMTSGFQRETWWLHGRLLITVKPFMFACPLFRELNKTAKLKGVNIDTVPNLIGITHVLESCGLNSPRIIMHAKSPTFRAAKLKGCPGFTVPGTQRLLSECLSHATSSWISGSAPFVLEKNFWGYVAQVSTVFTVIQPKVSKH